MSTTKPGELAPLINQQEDRVVIQPVADITAAGALELRSTLKTLINGGVMYITFDLSRVRMIDSSGIGVLVAAQNSLSRLQGKVALINVSPDLMQLFRSFRLDRHFDISPQAADR